MVAETKQLAGGRCEWKLPSGKRCPRKGTDCDHIDDKNDHSVGNRRWLCRHHHNIHTGEQALAARKPPVRAPEAHPGLRSAR